MNHAAPEPGLPGPADPPAFSPGAARLLALGLTAAVLVADALSPANMQWQIAYGIPLVVIAWTRSLPTLWALAGALVALTFIGHYLGPPPDPSALTSISLFNRGLSAGVILLVAGLVHFWMRSDRLAEDRRDALERQYDELEAVNRELGQREEEIVRQNEELRSTTEELERSSEELRVTNEELANREKMLEHLLELSRALTAELTREETLKRICEALGFLMNGFATGILEKHGDRLVMHCYHGFGPDGAESEEMPYEGSFTSLILSLGQTGYLEDLRLRPDLNVPRPKNREPFRSVMATPLRVHGRAVGTIEVYSTQPHAWSESHVAMAESLAAQASISLQNADLIQALRQERRRFESAFRTAPFGLAVADDPEGRGVRLNQAAAAMFGVPLDENVSPSTPAGARLRRNFFRADHPVPEEQLPLARALRGEDVQGEELDAVFPGSRRLTLLSSASPIYNEAGEVVGAVWAFADIAPQKQLQREIDLRRREAEEASVRKTRFLAAVSHDIRTPVNAINLLAEVIRRSAGTPEAAGQVGEMARRLQANALSLSELVTDVLDVARFDSGKVELQESEFGLGELVADECRQLLPLAQDKGLQLKVETPEWPVRLRSDRVKVGRILGNLVGNAIKFTDAGEVRVSARLLPDRQVELRVQDTGVGIPPEQQARIFDEFAQLRNPERDRNKGTGLGLAICKRLVEVLGGDIRVESEPGSGSTFVVLLPASCVLLSLDPPPFAEPSEPGPRPMPPAEGEALRVLLVEDHQATRESIARLLEDEGMRVRAAEDGRTAIDLLECEVPDVVLLDMMLPDMDGREILKRLHPERPPRLRGVVVMTGDLTAERTAEVKRLGADALIGKPIDVGQLIDRLHGLRRQGGRT